MAVGIFVISRGVRVGGDFNVFLRALSAPFVFQFKLVDHSKLIKAFFVKAKEATYVSMKETLTS